MKSNEFLDRFGRYNASFSRTDAEQRAMRLRHALIIPRGPRGPHAPHLEFVHMARLLIGITASDTATKAVDSTVEYAKMRPIGERLFNGADDFEIALTEIFKGEVDFDVREIVICRSWPEAHIIIKDSQSPEDRTKDKRFIFCTLEPPTHEKQFCRIDYCVGWAFFHDIWCNLRREMKPKPSKAGWDRALKLQKIKEEQGEAVAQKWAKENPLI